MFDNLVEVSQAYSFRTTLKTNIISSPGSAFGSSLSSMNFGNGARTNQTSTALSNSNYLSNYYLKLQELLEYKSTELTNTILTIFEDYIKNYIIDDQEIVKLDESIDNYKLKEAQLNKILSQIDFVGELKKNLRDYIYYESYAFKIMWDSEERTYKRFNLANPNSVIEITNGSLIPDSYLVVSNTGTIYNVSPYSIIQLGGTKISLINDINKDYFNDDEESLIKGTDFIGNKPLYYDNSSKVKEYLLKEQMLSLLSIKDLVQPLLLLLRVDNNTAPDEANKLALNVENLINKYSDISSILSTNFTIADLIDSLINNIRVLPDYQSGMGDMGNIDLTKITNKIQEIRSDQDNTKDSILNGLAIPRTLYSGDTTKWDAIKSSQRLNSRVASYVSNIINSVKDNVIKLGYMTFNEILDKKLITINLFRKTEADYNIAITNSEIITNLLDQINRIIDNLQRSIKESEIIDQEGYYNYVKEKLSTIDPMILNVFTDSEIKKYIKQIIDERSKKDENSGGFNGF